MESVKEIAKILQANYLKNTSSRTKLIDLFILFNLVLTFVQYVYMKLAGNFPYNAFLAGFFCTLGTATLTSCLRMSVESKKAEKSEEKAFIEYMALCLLLYLVVFNYLG
jgi:oligosaccharyltransferase complex subunit epsilon